MTQTTEAHDLILSIGGTATAAKLTGINPRTVSRWLSGQSEPSPDSLDLLRRLAASRTMPPFRDRLKSARDAAGLSQAQAAAAVSPLLSVRTLQAWELEGEDGRTPPDWTHDFILGRIAAACRLPG